MKSSHSVQYTTPILPEVNKSLFQVILESIAEPFFVLDFELNCLAHNQKLARIMQELYGITVSSESHFFVSVSNDVFAGKKEDVIRQIQTGETVRISGRLGNDRSAPRTFEFLISPYYAANHSVEGMTVSLKELLDTEKTISAFNFTEDIFRKAFMTSPDCVNINRLSDGRYILLNPGFTTIFGYTEDEILGETSLERNIWYDKTDRDCWVAELKETGEVKNFITRFRTKEGRMIYGTVSSSLIEIEGVMHVLSITRDISDLKAAEEKIKIRERELDTLVNVLPDLVWLKDSNGVYLNCNHRFESFFGATKEEIIGKSDFDFLSNELADFFRKHDANAIQAGKPTMNEEWVTFATDGHKEFLETIKTPIYDNNGKLLGVLGIGRDLTNRFQTDERLRRSENLFKTVFETSPDVMTITRLYDGIYVNVNDSFTNVLGYEAKEVVGRSALEKNIWYNAAERQLLVDILDRDGAAYNQEFRFLTKSNEVVYGLMSAKIIQIDGESHLLAITRPINDLKAAQDALKESEEKFRNIFEYSVVGKSITSIDGNLSVNKAFCDMVGYTEEELKQLNWKDITHPDDVDFKQNETQVLLNGLKKSTEFESRFIHKTGRIVWADINTILQRDKNGAPLYFVTVINDITDRKIAEKQIQENYDLLSKLTAQVPGVVYQYRLYPDGRSAFPYSSQGMFDIYEVTPEEVREDASPVFTRLHPDDYDEIVETITESARSQTVYHSEFRVILPGQGIRWRHCDAKPELLEDGSTLWYGIITDITDRKEAEKILQESEEKFRTLFENAPIPLCYADKNGTILLINNAYISLFGYDINDVSTMDEWWQKAYPDAEYRKWVMQNWGTAVDKTMNDGGNIEPEVYKVTCKDGSVKDIVISGISISDNLLGTFTDITARKKAEDALRESEDKLSTLFGSMTEMVVIHELVFDKNGDAVDYKILDCNDVFTTITGIPKNDAIGKLGSEVYQVMPPPYLEIYTQVGITGKPYEFTSLYSPMDKHFMISAVSPRTNQFATITSDISEIRQIQNELTIKNKELESYLYIASHDLRSPLVNIQGFSQRLQKQTTQLKSILSDLMPAIAERESIDTITNEAIPKTINFILSNVSKMDSLINSLLQISRTGRLMLNINIIDMNELVKTIVATKNFQLTELSVEVMIGNLNNCYGDMNQINQVFSNIIDNAIKYRDEKRQLKIEIKSEIIYNKVIYSIKDNGRGISERNIAKIWDVFYRVDAAEPGEGIGLSIAKTIISKHKGSIWVESEYGMGSTFFIELHLNEFSE